MPATRPLRSHHPSKGARCVWPHRTRPFRRDHASGIHPRSDRPAFPARAFSSTSSRPDRRWLLRLPVEDGSDLGEQNDPITPANRLEKWLLRSLEKKTVVLPAFPTMASRLVDALESPDVEVETVEEIISQDGSITAQVIRASNSVYYGAACPAQDLHQAIMRIGFRETANVAMLAASRTLFEMEDRAELSCFPDLWPRLWQSSLVCAFGANLLSREIKLGNPSHVFLSATLRDVGSLLILKLLAAGLVHGRLRDKPSEEQLRDLFDHLHTRLGADYLRENRMPEYVIDVAERHHLLDLPFAHDTILIHLIRCADGLCERIGVTPFPEETDESACETEPGISPAAQESASLLGIDDARLEYFTLQFEGIREQVGGLMDAP
ncbi:MAG TPA: HDOD domain-containing protein [Deltaproteobacteria bacterium]|nr:HDOD domain-containing protein [Deltaproteobacteria bacterium]